MKREGNLVVAKVDAEKEKLLAKRYKIGNYPTVYFFYYGFIEEFYVDQQIWLPEETGKTEKIKLTKCQDDEDQRNFDAPLKELQDPIRSYEKFMTLEDAPVEDEAPRRSDEKISWKVVPTEPGVDHLYPDRTSGQSTEINLDDTTSDEEPFKQSSEEFAFERDLTGSSEYRAEPETKFHAPLKELQEPVRFYVKITILENAPVEDEAPTRSDEKPLGKVEPTQAGVINISPYQRFTQSAEEFAMVKSHERLRETEKNTLNQNQIGGMDMTVGEFKEDDKNLKGPTDYNVKSSSTKLRWIFLVLDTENDAKEEKIEEPAPKIPCKVLILVRLTDLDRLAES
ncbi:hypothetical protein Pint_06053 [Pistacia integerrima]|uniref:Uncharacterized protein n=1 Tax=Pistacia integerrima TaxID=434235 RepID=A0ACC0Z208_9ROSI|nr:hypothetical protein Pint_06053 [Pistacia integerrima]